MSEKKIRFAIAPREKHWVGNGFHVSTLIMPSRDMYPYTSPFVLLDYAAPRAFEPSHEPKGVGEHPHRGFETVTFAYQGEVSHKDSGGGGGTITQGGVQWMTAGSGVVHEEFHSKRFTETGGMFEMVQLWVNLPKKDKMTQPRYQDQKDEDFPRVALTNRARARVIAGTFLGETGPCQTYTTMTVFDLDVEAEAEFTIPLADGTNTVILVLRGEVEIQGNGLAQSQLVAFDRQGTEVTISSPSDAKLLVLNGEPIDEPIAAQGPFVMNYPQEIIQAIADFRDGKMGRL